MKVGYKTTGLEVKIKNNEEVERAKTAIEKRYGIYCMAAYMSINKNISAVFIREFDVMLLTSQRYFCMKFKLLVCTVLVLVYLF